MSSLGRLEAYLRARERMAIAVSGGVDSMTLAVVAHRTVRGTQIFHAVSAAVPPQATERVRRYADLEGWDLHVIDAGEMRDPRYVANPANRCYFCKTNLYDSVLGATRLAVASGTNLDDLADYRPGLVAAEEHQVRHPYVAVEIDKRGVRGIAAELGLDDLKDLPAAPCLSSRVTTGISIDPGLLPVINEVELRVRELLAAHMRLEGVRCRVLRDEVVLQVESPDEVDFDGPLFEAPMAAARRSFVAAGYADQVAAIRVEAYRRGSAFLIETLEVG